ncbi:unnamed protein product, partial [Callosobruchus maculatus]
KATIAQITGACKTLAGNEYIARHNSAAKVIHQALATTNRNPNYNYIPTPALKNNRCNLY